jgi:hypothetical protein
MADSVKVLAEAARQEGLDIEEEALSVYYAQAAIQAQSSDLSDAQLDAVAGGYTDIEWLFISIFTFGMGCPTTIGGCL